MRGKKNKTKNTGWKDLFVINLVRSTTSQQVPTDPHPIAGMKWVNIPPLWKSQLYNVCHLIIHFFCLPKAVLFRYLGNTQTQTPSPPSFQLLELSARLRLKWVKYHVCIPWQVDKTKPQMFLVGCASAGTMKYKYRKSFQYMNHQFFKYIKHEALFVNNNYTLIWCLVVAPSGAIPSEYTWQLNSFQLTHRKPVAVNLFFIQMFVICRGCFVVYCACSSGKWGSA